jgi:hypothetical protein
MTPPSAILRVHAPDYKAIIPSAYLRRSSHIQKMGIGSALLCLKNAGISSPEAITVGTGMGCFEDTDRFLRSMVENDETLVSPTPFIQSTHNSVAGQIALITNCKGYNFTYVHQNIAFECAVQDALMLLEEVEVTNVLCGGVDELAEALQDFLSLAGHLKKPDAVLKPLWLNDTEGYVGGEGSAFFLLSKQKTDQALGKILGVRTIQQNSGPDDLLSKINDFLIDEHLPGPDLVLSGANGDGAYDATIMDVHKRMQVPVGFYKNICGEYFASGSFALFLALGILKHQRVPEAICAKPLNVKPKTILIINQYRDQQYSLLYLSAC